MNKKGDVKTIVIVIILMLMGAYYFFVNRKVSYGPGVHAANAPEQKELKHDKIIEYKKYSIKLLAEFHIKAKVLSRKNYYFGRDSELSPVDLALGWGRMSDESILKKIEISQSSRWYYWDTKEFPIPREEIEANSANMHLIPADSEVAKQMKRVRTGHLVEFQGYLISVSAPDGWYWTSSLTRQDRGDHSCELVWVEKFQIL